MPMGIFKSRYRLPQKHCTEIGRIASRFAVLEARIAYCAYTLLRVSKKEGRVAVRMGRIDSALTVVEDLLAIHGLTVATKIKKLKPAFKSLENARDLLCHGLWVYHTKSHIPVVQYTSGSYQSEDTNQPVKARIDPQGVAVPLHELKQTVKLMDAAAKQVNQLGKEIDSALKAQQRASLEKSPSPQPAHRSRGRQSQKEQ